MKYILPLVVILLLSGCANYHTITPSNRIPISEVTVFDYSTVDGVSFYSNYPDQQMQELGILNTLKTPLIHEIKRDLYETTVRLNNYYEEGERLFRTKSVRIPGELDRYYKVEIIKPNQLLDEIAKKVKELGGNAVVNLQISRYTAIDVNLDYDYFELKGVIVKI
jgi:uncharacterized protein YbjQ (UPF0145 family)